MKGSPFKSRNSYSDISVQAGLLEVAAVIYYCLLFLWQSQMSILRSQKQTASRSFWFWTKNWQFQHRADSTASPKKVSSSQISHTATGGVHGRSPSGRSFIFLHITCSWCSGRVLLSVESCQLPPPGHIRTGQRPPQSPQSEVPGRGKDPHRADPQWGERTNTDKAFLPTHHAFMCIELHTGNALPWICMQLFSKLSLKNPSRLCTLMDSRCSYTSDTGKAFSTGTGSKGKLTLILLLS